MTTSISRTSLTVSAIAGAALALGGCQDRGADAASGEPQMDAWGVSPLGRPVHLFTLRNGSGMTARITDYGATVISLTAPDRKGNLGDVVLGYNTLAEYVQPGHSPFFGTIAGRYANRIAGGKFTLEGKDYTLAINNTPAGKPCSLHGGKQGFDKVVWTATPVSTAPGGQAIKMTYVSKDGEEGYPGTLTLSVTYLLGPDDALHIAFEATTDKTTVLNPTNHSYFNLAGEGSGDILSHVLTLNASKMTVVNDGLIPTGEIKPVTGTPFDFTKPHTIGERVNADEEQLKFGGGYDHNFVIDRTTNDLVLAARVEEPTSGRVLEVLTTEPGIQLYIGNFLPKADAPEAEQLIGKSGKKYHYRGAFCLETQHYPDSPNQPTFPTTVLRPGETFASQTIYRFSTK
ncbi:MAG TPA: aldose epimerase family protein [Planctomycetota bacterium]|jgi:aldose 1-epimerase|nr:aldose epimerase family protein [Planctomycetota bacterium]